MTPISSRLTLSIVPCYTWDVRRDTITSRILMATARQVGSTLQNTFRTPCKRSMQGNPPVSTIHNEAVSAQPVPVLKEAVIPDICESLLEQERQGAPQILRYGDLTQEMLSWIRDKEAAEIRKHCLLHSDLPWWPTCGYTIPKAEHSAQRQHSSIQKNS